MVIMASTTLIHSWLKFNYMSMFTMHIATCLQTSNLDVFNPKESRPCWMYWCVLCTNLLYFLHNTLL